MACTTLGDMSYSSYARKIRIPRSRIAAIQFILSKLRKSILMNVKFKTQIRYFWFIEELLQKILTTGERCFYHNLEFAEFELKNFIGAILNHPAVIELVKLDELQSLFLNFSAVPFHTR